MVFEEFKNTELFSKLIDNVLCNYLSQYTDEELFAMKARYELLGESSILIDMSDMLEDYGLYFAEISIEEVKFYDLLDTYVSVDNMQVVFDESMLSDLHLCSRLKLKGKLNVDYKFIQYLISLNEIYSFYSFMKFKSELVKPSNRFIGEVSEVHIVSVDKDVENINFNLNFNNKIIYYEFDLNGRQVSVDGTKLYNILYKPDNIRKLYNILNANCSIDEKNILINLNNVSYQFGSSVDNESNYFFLMQCLSDNIKYKGDIHYWFYINVDNYNFQNNLSKIENYCLKYIKNFKNQNFHLCFISPVIDNFLSVNDFMFSDLKSVVNNIISVSDFSDLALYINNKKDS